MSEDAMLTGKDEGLETGTLPEEAEPALPVAEEIPPEPPPAPPAAGPRTFPEHYTLLLGGAMVLASSLSVWERKEIYGAEIWGGHSILRTVMMGLAAYMLAVGISNISTGRLKGMGLAFVTGVMALWLGIKGFLAFDSVDGFRGWTQIKNDLEATTGFNKKIGVETFLSQWAPGVWLATIGGALIILIFVKAILFGGKGKAPTPPPAPARRRGRR